MENATFKINFDIDGRDLASKIVFAMVFLLPLSTLIPGFSVFDYIPKLRVYRYHFLRFDFTWMQINIAMLLTIVILFTIFLEIRKRRLDELMMHVLEAENVTEKTMSIDRQHRSSAIRGCSRLLEASADHYEQLIMLQDDLRHRRNNMTRNAPPEIEPSTSTLCDLSCNYGFTLAESLVADGNFTGHCAPVDNVLRRGLVLASRVITNELGEYVERVTVEASAPTNSGFTPNSRDSFYSREQFTQIF